jgi:phenylalanyl-tRNA synthetase beta chain
MDIDQEVFYAEFNWEEVVALAGSSAVRFAELNKYPSIKRDLALQVDEAVTFEQMAKIAKKLGSQILRDIDLFDVYQDKKMGEKQKSYAISFIFRDDHKTLNDKEVDSIMKRMIEAYTSELNAVIR